jgi:hypothetical protein
MTSVSGVDWDKTCVHVKAGAGSKTSIITYKRSPITRDRWNVRAWIDRAYVALRKSEAVIEVDEIEETHYP